SFDVVGKLRNTMKPLKLKVGHAGTLDPLATGLLIICTGKLTKKIDTFQAEDKEYTGIITLGATTPSYDLETEIVQTFDISAITEEEILAVAKSFEGEQEQLPPAHSAVKIKGERVYEKARRGEDVELKPRNDTEFGRLLVETGMARRGDDGRLIYDPAATSTAIVIVGDNGTLAAAVKQPFEATQAKGTTYQTGVWAPLIVAGPQVVEPGRQVDHMLNMVDLYQLFGELAGVDVHAEVPRTVDSVSVLPYLTNPEQPSLRTINFAMAGLN